MTWNLINGFCLTKHEIYVGNLFRTIYSLEDTNLFASTAGTLFLALKSRTIGCGSSRPAPYQGRCCRLRPVLLKRIKCSRYTGTDSTNLGCTPLRFCFPFHDFALKFFLVLPPLQLSGLDLLLCLFSDLSNFILQFMPDMLQMLNSGCETIVT